MSTPRAFTLVRDVDVSGVSGTGVVAEGVAFSTGIVALHWLGDWPTSVVFHERGIASVEHIHGHGGSTRIVWAESADDVAAKTLAAYNAGVVAAISRNPWTS